MSEKGLILGGFRSARWLVHLMLLAAIYFPQAWAADLQELLKEGDAKAAKHQTKEALQLFRQADQISPNNPEVDRRISEQLSDLLDEEPSAQRARESLDYAL